MKKNRIFSALSAIALLMAGACSDDTLKSVSDDGGNKVEEGGLYLTINFELPSAKETRSYTNGENSSSGGTEVAKDYENNVKSVAVVLARKSDNGYIASSLFSEDILESVGTSGRSFKTTSTFSKTELASLYNDEEYKTMEGMLDNNGNYLVNVFVFCNPTTDLRDGWATVDKSYSFKGLKNLKYGDTSWVDGCGTYAETKNQNGNGEASIWKPNSFLMSNSKICTRLLPPSLDDWDAFATKATAFNLSGINNLGRPNEIDNYNEKGNISVERVAARYDFRDGALDGAYIEENPKTTDKTFNGCGPQTYHVVLDSDEAPLLDIYLAKMSLVNMNNRYYYLRRVSNNGRPVTSVDNESNGYVLCGNEMPWYTNATGALDLTSGNYVVDAWADWKYTTPTNGFDTHFVYPFFDEDGSMSNVEVAQDRWYTSVIANVLTGETDNAQTWNPDPDGTKYEPYHIWRYLTEGTIPADPENQQNGISNGVVFKGRLQPAREAKDGDNEFTKKLLETTVPEQVAGHPTDDPILYVFSGHVYCTWDNIRRQAIALAITSITKNEEGKWVWTANRTSALYHAVFGNGGFGEINFSYNENKVNFFDTNGTETIIDEQPQADGTQKDPTTQEIIPACPNYLYAQWHSEDVEDVTFTTFRDAAVDNNIALYQKSYDPDLGGWSYYCYYYYWNRHNDNGKAGEMGPMEFDVVRNNVYKLAVTKIARLGHPRNPENDPDKPTPNTPDEKDDLYITVTCTSLPWVVRVNNIEF